MAQVTVVRCVAVVLTMAVGSLAASFGKGKPCPAGEFYDHGTEQCEPCIGICLNANLTKMVHKCQTLCPATFAQLNNRQKLPESSHLSSHPHQSSSSPTSFTGPSVVLVAGVIGGIVLVSFLVIVGAFVCKRVQDNGPNSSGGASGAGGGGAGQQGSSDRGLNRSRQGYRPAGVQEEGGDQADEERQQAAQQQQGRGLLRSYCDPRHWFAAGPPPGAEEVPAEETESGRQGPQDMALLGNSHGSVVQDLSQPKTVITTPIYKPSGSMRSTATRI